MQHQELGRAEAGSAADSLGASAGRRAFTQRPEAQQQQQALAGAAVESHASSQGGGGRSSTAGAAASSDAAASGTPRGGAAPSPSVALCLVARDQHKDDITEWLEYHRSIGVSRVYLWDHNSSTPLHQVPAVRAGIASGFVSYRQFVRFLHPKRLEERFPQTACYNYCIQDYGHLHDWMGFIDADEFIVLRNAAKGKGLPALLANYTAYGGLCLSLRLFGSSGHVRRPEGGVLANYYRCFQKGGPEQKLCKMIVQPRLVVEEGVHDAAFVGNPPAFAVDEMFNRVDGPTAERWYADLEVGKVVLHHYAIKSREDMAMKNARGSAMGNPPKNESFWNHIEELSTAVCTEGLEAALNQTAVHATLARIEAEQAEAAQAKLEGIQAAQAQTQAAAQHAAVQTQQPLVQAQQEVQRQAHVQQTAEQDGSGEAAEGGGGQEAQMELESGSDAVAITRL